MAAPIGDPRLHGGPFPGSTAQAVGLPGRLGPARRGAPIIHARSDHGASRTGRAFRGPADTRVVELARLRPGQQQRGLAKMYRSATDAFTRLAARDVRGGGPGAVRAAAPAAPPAPPASRR